MSRYKCTECLRDFELTLAKPRLIMYPRKATHLEIGTACEDCWQHNESRRYKEEPKCDQCGEVITGLESCSNSVTEGTYCSMECSGLSMRKEYDKRMAEVKRLEKICEPPIPTGRPLSDFDNVDAPRHYKYHDLDTFDFLEGGFAPEVFEGFLVGNVIKYIQRYPLKNGLEDLKKAQKYLDKLIELKDNK